MRASETGLNLIKGYEGLRLHAHYAPSEQWSVGYGHTASARHGMQVSEQQADQFLRMDSEPIERLIEEVVMAPLNQNEFDALVSLIFNIGEDNFRRSTVLKKLNEGDRLGAAQAFEMWNKSRIGDELVVLDGLVRRRAAEKSLFLMPVNSDIVVPTSDASPAPECEVGYLSDEELKAVPLIDLEEARESAGEVISEEEQAGRMRALFAASQAITGDPSKMIISKEEERADFGVTVGAVLAGMLGFAMAALGAVILFGMEWPGLAAAVGLTEDRLIHIFDDLPLWMAGVGAAITYFVFYIVVKRGVRHDLKRQRARELARLKVVK
ncbi:MAG: lysozyme [Pseudomonadota bacterium]